MCLGLGQQGCAAGLGHVSLDWTWLGVPEILAFFRTPVGQGECLLHLGDNLTWNSLETDSETESCLWKVYLQGSSQEEHLERRRGSVTAQREVLPGIYLMRKVTHRELWSWAQVCPKLRQGGCPLLEFLCPLVAVFRQPHV